MIKGVDEEDERDSNKLVVIEALVLLSALMIISAQILRMYLDKRKRKHVHVEKLQIATRLLTPTIIM